MILYVNLFPAGPVQSLENVIKLNQIRSELNAARNRWQSHSFSNYNFDFHGEAFSQCFMYYSDEATLVIHDNALFTVTVPSDAHIRDVANWLHSCDYEDYLPEQMFQRVERLLREIDPLQAYLRVEFDPEYGYITSFRSGCYYPVSDCGTNLTFSNFSPLEIK
jgi:hypothetical protein